MVPDIALHSRAAITWIRRAAREGEAKRGMSKGGMSIGGGGGEREGMHPYRRGREGRGAR